MANCAARLSGMSTKPNPRGEPVSRSVIILIVSTAPYGSKSWRTSCSVALNARLPTKMFTRVSSGEKAWKRSPGHPNSVQKQAQPVADLRQRQGGRQLLTPVGFTEQEPHRNQRQRHVVMPALPGAHLVLIHPDLALAPFETRFNAQAGFDHPHQFRQRRRLELDFRHTRRREVIAIAVPAVLLRGIRRGLSLQDAVVRKETTGD